VNDRVAFCLLACVGFGTLAIQGFLLRMSIPVTTIAAAVTIALAGAAWASWGKR